MFLWKIIESLNSIILMVKNFEFFCKNSLTIYFNKETDCYPSNFDEILAHFNLKIFH